MDARGARDGDEGESKHDDKRRKSSLRANGKAPEIAPEAWEDALIKECQRAHPDAKKVEDVIVCFLKRIMGANARKKQEGLPGDLDKLCSLFELMQNGKKGAPYREYVVCGRQGEGGCVRAR